LTIKIGNETVGQIETKVLNMVQRRTLTLTAIERQALRDHRDHDPRPQARERCAALLKIAEGQSPHEVAQTGLLKPRDPDTVYRWLNQYESGGIAGLLSRLQGGKRRSFR
jgi:hypothetical protein